MNEVLNALKELGSIFVLIACYILMSLFLAWLVIWGFYLFFSFLP